MNVGIVGCGFAGGSGAYAVTLTGAASEIVLIDVNAALARARAEDILPTLHPSLSPDEQAALERSAAALVAAAREVGY